MSESNQLTVEAEEKHKSLGQLSYEAYCGQTGWKSAVSGALLPGWENVNPAIRAAWESAGRAVSEDVLNVGVKSPTWPYVIAFARVMEFKLSKNRHKGNREGWVNCDVRMLMNLLKRELVELEAAYNLGDVKNVELEAADVANFAMMISDWFKSRC